MDSKTPRLFVHPGSRVAYNPPFQGAKDHANYCKGKHFGMDLTGK